MPRIQGAFDVYRDSGIRFYDPIAQDEGGQDLAYQLLTGTDRTIQLPVRRKEDVPIGRHNNLYVCLLIEAIHLI
jgi:hypothetical protein